MENPAVSSAPRSSADSPGSTPTLKVLHLEDNSADAEIVQGFFDAEFPSTKITQVASRFAFTGEMRLRAYDLIISDFSLEGFDGLEALGLARDLAPNVPVVFYSGTIGEERASEAIARGARDCVPKGQIKRLGAAIRRVIGEAGERRMRHETENRNAALERALHDAGVAHQRLEEKSEHIQRLENVGALTGDVAHDLNNLLAPLLMALPMLRDLTPTPEGRRIIDTLEKSARRGASLVAQILAIIENDADDPATISLEGPIQGSVSFMGVCFPKNITVEKSVAPDLRRVKAASAQMSQMLLNLCFSARNAMPGGGTLTLRAENCSLDAASAHHIPGARAGEFVRLFVEDTGLGMATTALRKLIGSVPEAPTERSPGLSAVRNIVKRHDGFIQVQTATALGTSVRIYLPAVVA